MGESGGDVRDCDSGPNIRTAIITFGVKCPPDFAYSFTPSRDQQFFPICCPSLSSTLLSVRFLDVLAVAESSQ